MPKQKTSPETQQLAPRVTMQAVGLLRADYKSVNHGAQEACRSWPLVRRAAIKDMKRKYKFTKKERELLQNLQLPHDCDQTDLVEILKENKINCDTRVKMMDRIHAIVFIDLIRNNDLKLLGVAKNRDGEEI